MWNSMKELRFNTWLRKANTEQSNWGFWPLHLKNKTKKTTKQNLIHILKYSKAYTWTSELEQRFEINYFCPFSHNSWIPESSQLWQKVDSSSNLFCCTLRVKPEPTKLEKIGIICGFHSEFNLQENVNVTAEF